MISNTQCILCGTKLTSINQRCGDCQQLQDILNEIFYEAKNQLSSNPSIERETIFKILREFAFIVQEDALLRAYKNSVAFFLSKFIDFGLSETTLESFTKRVHTRLNQIKILNELAICDLIKWEPSDMNSGSSIKIYPGNVIINLKTTYERTTIPNRTEQRFGHAMAFYSILPLLINYGTCKSKDEIKRINVVPKKPWVITLSIMIGNQDGKISLERTNKFLKKRRGVGNIYGTIITNLSSLSTDHIQKVTVDSEVGDNNDHSYVISNDIVRYLDNLRENIRMRQRGVT